LALWGWQLTLFAETRVANPEVQLQLGRLNFAAMAWAAYFAWRFVGTVSPHRPESEKRRWPIGNPGAQNLVPWCRAQTAFLAGLTQFTPLIDAAERVEAGVAISTYGPLFPLYVAHVVLYWLAALALVARARQQAPKATARGQRVRSQLGWIGGGMLLTGGVALVANLLLPYRFGDFRFCDLGALSTLLFLLAIAYATLWRGLFELRVLAARTLLFGILLAFVLGSYSSALFVIAQFLTESAGKWTQFAVLFIAFSLDPLRRYLEKKIDSLLFSSRSKSRPKSRESQRPERAEPGENRERHGKPRHGRRRGSARGVGRSPLALVFPWRS
jgi:hypothetical protein